MKLKKSIDANMSQEEFRRLARKRYVRLPPGEKRPYTYGLPGKNYVYFSALWHIDNGMITPRLVSRLQQGADILSVGAGEGNLEKFLHFGFGVSPKHIAITDLNSDPSLKKYDFETYEFDITQNWPPLGREFDYVVFSESFGVSTISHSKPLLEEIPVHLLKKIDEIASAIRFKHKITSQDIEFFKSHTQELSGAVVPSFIIEQALSQLKPRGEIRMGGTGGLGAPFEEAYFMLKYNGSSGIMGDIDRNYCGKSSQSPFIITKL